MRSNFLVCHPLAAGLAVGLGTLPALAGGDGYFRRVASFPVFSNTSEELETVAETVASALGGHLLVYTDSTTGNVGFVDIADPSDPQPAGVVSVGGEPTSVAVKGGFALVCVDTSPDFVNPSGELAVIDVITRAIVRTIPLGGQPDSITISPDGRYAAIAIENERDEDAGDGAPPQFPPGFVVIVDLVGPPQDWSTRTVDLVGVPDLFPQDPEPEFVDINSSNVAAVTLQENNHVVLIRLSNGNVVGDFSAGAVNLAGIDTNENDLIEQVDSLALVPREPDAVVWTSNLTLATADEGDLFGGSRGFTTWVSTGFPLFQAGNAVERLIAHLGHYPEDRSENKGGEPEGIEFARYGNERFLFVGSERANVVIVCELFPAPFIGNAFPQLRQVLPAGVGPEGMHAIPERGLFIVASEVDDRADKIRSTIMLYELCDESTYPTVLSLARPGGDVPIPWAALSGLAADPDGCEQVYAVHDSYYRKSRVYGVDVAHDPARIESEIVLNDSQGVLLASLEGLKAQLPGTDDFDPSDAIEDDGSVNLDLEGIALVAGGGFWFASEGAGNLENGVSDPDDRPFEKPNLLVRATSDGTIEQVILPPIELTRNQFRFGLEGVALNGGYVYVAFQRAWGAAGDPSGRARIGRVDPGTGEWTFAYYPLATPTSPNGGWVGLSELTSLGAGRFAVIERDDQGGPDARIKHIATFSVEGVTFGDDSQTPGFDVLVKSLADDLIATDAYGPGAGPIPEKQEGLAVICGGTVLVVNDNDGVDDNNGETRLLRLPGLLD